MSRSNYLLLWLDKRIYSCDILLDRGVRDVILECFMIQRYDGRGHLRKIEEQEYLEIVYHECIHEFSLFLDTLYSHAMIMTDKSEDCKVAHVVIKYLMMYYPETIITQIDDDNIHTINAIINLYNNPHLTVFMSKKIINFKTFDNAI